MTRAYITEDSEIHSESASSVAASWPGDPDAGFDDLNERLGAAHVVLERFLGPDGHIAHVLPGFERRAGQEHMMRAVMDALVGQRVLLTEAGTGTGKSLAYLLPAVLSGLRVIVATGTKTLQDQLFDKQIPFIREHLGIPFEAAVLKGRTNYLCLLLLEQARHVPDLALDKRAELDRIVAWANTTATGDRGELAEVGDGGTVWRAVAADQEQCLGRQCPHFDRCFLMEARRRAASADIVVVNHHLFFADLALTAEREIGLLPAADAVILDEAHHIEDVAASAFGRQISDVRHLRLAADLRRALLRVERLGAEAEAQIDGLTTDARTFWKTLRSNDLGRQVHRPERLSELQKDALARLDNRLIGLGLLARRLADGDEALLRLAERAEEVRSDTWELVMAGDGGPEPSVRWLEDGPRAMFLRSAPISVASALERYLFRRFPRVVFTSATLAVAEDFAHVRDRLGIAAEAPALRVPSPFDHAQQALLFVPGDLPEPNHPEHLRCAVDHIARLVDLTGGDALLLFTSYQKMRDAHAALAPTWRYPTLIQGELGKEALLGRFRAVRGSVLFATQTFWEGVDIPGDALSLVVIDKLPFQSPGDPLVDARLDALRRAGRNPFVDDQLPRAAIALKQGLGRLIRHRADRGVAAILDPRLLRARYGRWLLDAMPPFRRTSDFDEVEAFWRELETQRKALQEAPGE
jgi:ATP-dependent DNA helicase DinG